MTNDFLRQWIAIGPESEIKKNVTVVGSSFIGMEVALAASKRANVNVVGMDSVPFKAILGEAVGKGIQKVSLSVI